MACRKRSSSNDAVVSVLYKELDEAPCPICMDHPHNAVLLICSSHVKGCRSYICDTSYRHSNCLDRYKKLKEDNMVNLSAPSLIQETQLDTTLSSDRNPITDIIDNHLNISLAASRPEASFGESGVSRQGGNQNTSPDFEDQQSTSWERLNLEEIRMEKFDNKSNLKCPLCRGAVLGWKVVEEARKYLNLKPRSCSHEECSFFGNYSELRRHARSVHPTVRPADVDPSRQSAWHRFERQREYNDIVSAIRSAMPSAIVLGDYAIDNGDRLSGERDNSGGGGEGSRLFSTFFLFHMFGSMDPESELRGGRSRVLSRYRRPSGSSRHRYLWGENLLGLQDHDNNDHDEDDGDDELDLNILSDIGDGGLSSRRRRRRLTHSHSDEDQP